MKAHPEVLNDLFTITLVQLNLPPGDRAWLREYLYSQDHTNLPPLEFHLVGCLLRWIVQGTRDAYHTRSNLVASVAACLKATGYTIGTIQTWDGTGDPPSLLGPRAVLLVLGGSSTPMP